MLSFAHVERLIPIGEEVEILSLYNLCSVDQPNTIDHPLILPHQRRGKFTDRRRIQSMVHDFILHLGDLFSDSRMKPKIVFCKPAATRPSGPVVKQISNVFILTKSLAVHNRFRHRSQRWTAIDLDRRRPKCFNVLTAGLRGSWPLAIFHLSTSLRSTACLELIIQPELSLNNARKTPSRSSRTFSSSKPELPVYVSLISPKSTYKGKEDSITRCPCVS